MKGLKPKQKRRMESKSKSAQRITKRPPAQAPHLTLTMEKQMRMRKVETTFNTCMRDSLQRKYVVKTVCIFPLASLSVLVGLDNLEDIISVALIEQVAKVLRSDNWSKRIRTSLKVLFWSSTWYSSSITFFYRVPPPVIQWLHCSWLVWCTQSALPMLQS